MVTLLSPVEYAVVDNGSVVSVLLVQPGFTPDQSIHRVVNQGNRPAQTSIASDVRQSGWTITDTEAIRVWEQVAVPVDVARGRKERLADAQKSSEDAPGITVTLAPYGAMTFAADAAIDMLVCAYLCDVEIRSGGRAAADMLRPLMLADGSLVEVKCGDALKIIHSFLTQHRTRHLAHATKLRAVRLATTTAELEAIT